jgi:hypothetical protein
VIHKTIVLVMAVFAITAWDCLTQQASADGIAAVRRARIVYRPTGCPDRFSCYSIYGAYGPYGGPAYWGRYGYSGYHPINGYFGVWSPWPLHLP